MKKFLILFFMFCALPALAETISAVSFNPMRVGNFRDSLKVTQGAIFRSGLYTWSDSEYGCQGKGVFELRGPSSKMINHTDSQRYYINKVDTLPPPLNAHTQADVKVTFSRTTFRNSSGPDTYDLSDPNSWPSAGTILTSRGGLAIFKEPSKVLDLDFPAFDTSKDCWSSGFKPACASRLFIYAKQFKVPLLSKRQLLILGSSVLYDKGKLHYMNSDFTFPADGYTRGLLLGHINISKPRGAVQTYNGNVYEYNNANTPAAPPTDLSKCSLSWSGQKEVVGENRRVKILYMHCTD